MRRLAKMRALRFHGQRDIRLEDIEEPATKPGWVKIAPAFVGICGSDIHEYLGGNNLIPRPGHPHPITGETSPVTLGHEFSGIVEEVGEGVSDLEPGERICVQPTLYCSDCHACKHDTPNCCRINGFIGLSGFGGGLADHIVVPRSTVWKLPPKVTMELGALVEPLAVGWHAVDITPIAHPIPSGTPILVLGGGPIGLCIIQAILAQSSSPSSPPLIIVSEPSSTRQKFALDFGAGHAINPMQTDLIATVLELTQDKGVEIVFDCAGVQEGLDQAIKCLRARGTLVQIAVWEKKAALTMNDVVFRERSIMGVATYGNEDFGHVLKAIDEGKLNPERMITRKIKLEEVETKGFRALIEEKDTQVKVLVEINPSDTSLL